jgi:uncharacterized protein YggU (UPF0235/DUF167 family)
MGRDDEQLPARGVPGGIAIHARITPKASADEVFGVESHDGGLVLKVRVRALPDKGEANAAVVALLAKWLGEPKARLKVAAGAKARLKLVVVEGDPPALMAKLAARLMR